MIPSASLAHRFASRTGESAIFHPVSTRWSLGELPPAPVDTAARLLKVRWLKLAYLGYLALRHRRATSALKRARPGTALAKFVARRPEVWGMVMTPYLSANYSAADRYVRLVDHCETIETLGPFINTPPDGYFELMTLDEIDPAYRIVLEQPRWLLRDGQAAVSLWEGGDRLFTLAYCLGRSEGPLTAFIGGLQGRCEAGALDRYRTLTRKAEGLRPADLLFEVFRMICAALRVARILAISDAAHYQNSAYFKLWSGGRSTDQRLSYDAIWEGRGGAVRPDGFFEMPPCRTMRDAESIRPNKRAMYRRRYAALDAIDRRIAMTLRQDFDDRRLRYYE